MQTKMGFTTATRAETLARLLHGEREGAEGRALERAEPLAHMVETDWRRAIVWLRQTLDYEGVTRPVLAGLGFDWLGIGRGRHPGRAPSGERARVCEASRSVQ